jgi:uncharacterized membrane-anchored protein
MRALLLGLILGFGLAASAAAETGETELTAEEAEAEAAKLNWILDPGDYPLPLSHGVIRLPEGYSMLAGADAARYDLLWNGIESRNTEAIVFSEVDDTLAYFIYEDSGHVAEDDWKRVDAAYVLRELKASDAAANEARRKAGLEEFHTGEWREPPRYDAASKTAVWAYELASANSRFINATAIRLSRTGYHQILWVGDVARVSDPAARLNELLAMLDHEAGYRYRDYAEGDKRADFGVGALAAGLLGVELQKRGFLKGLVRSIFNLETMVALFVVLVGGVLLWRWWRRSMR